MARKKKAEDEELKGEVLATEVEESDMSEPSVSTCPNCSSPVMDNWKVCPICGTGLE
jgi:rubrerythrin